MGQVIKKLMKQFFVQWASMFKVHFFEELIAKQVDFHNQ